MSLSDELSSELTKIFGEHWDTRAGQLIPESHELKLGNDSLQVTGTVLCADLSGSTALVDNFRPSFAAEVYKAYLHCAAKIIQSEGGVITAYDGDRLMAVYVGEYKNQSAARSGLKINWVVKELINPLLQKHYPNAGYEVHQKVGIDTSDLFVTRTGIRGAHDLVWVGRSANHAAKLTALSHDYPTRITEDVFKSLPDNVKQGANGAPMWERVPWIGMNNRPIYRSTWYWRLD